MRLIRDTLLMPLTLLAMQALAAPPAGNQHPAQVLPSADASGRATDSWLDGLNAALTAAARRKPGTFPVSFLYGGRPSSDLIGAWPRHVEPLTRDGGRSRACTTLADPQSSLRLKIEVSSFADFPAVEWLLWLENTGRRDTPILSGVQALDLVLDEPRIGEACYLLHQTNGAPASPSDFEPSLIELRPGAHATLGGGGGRSSNKDLPFVKIESARASYIIAVGWSGQWAMNLACGPDRRLRITAGLERTHFTLHPGERVRLPRILLYRREGDTLEANARFRELIYKHYAARRNGLPPLPALFCNTCFTRGGGWLNECNAENQISLIRAYAPLGLEALITDAGWFEGGWPAGAGNWSPRQAAYPGGMAPVAAAARRNGMVYGLWFEFERVVPGTSLARQHPGWLLTCGGPAGGACLLNLGLPEVRQHLFDIVKGFMDLPGFRFYRSDFNMDPLPYWRNSDAADRQGVTEMKYVAGLYEFWDRLAAAWPDSFREECASGGRRIDLETVMRMHLHQESDYWFDNEVDLARAWSLSRYLPNCVFTTPLVRMDDRSFHSTMAASLIPAWIADARDFDRARAKQLTDAYLRLRHLLLGRFYPLTPYARDGKHWMVLQFDRRDLAEGLLLVVPPRNSMDRHFLARLRGLSPQADYEIHAEVRGTRLRASGAQLESGLQITLPPGDGGDRIVYIRL